MTEGDPTDDALATIASILDHPEARREPERPVLNEGESMPTAPVGADGYFKDGPGPVAAMRFRWTARRGENGNYYIDETIGKISISVVSGPMSRDEAIKLVDERQRDAREKFEQIKSEMVSRAAAAHVVRNGAGQ